MNIDTSFTIPITLSGQQVITSLYNYCNSELHIHSDGIKDIKLVAEYDKMGGHIFDIIGDYDPNAQESHILLNSGAKMNLTLPILYRAVSNFCSEISDYYYIIAYQYIIPENTDTLDRLEIGQHFSIAEINIVFLFGKKLDLFQNLYLKEYLQSILFLHKQFPSGYFWGGVGDIGIQIVDKMITSRCFEQIQEIIEYHPIYNSFEDTDGLSSLGFYLLTEKKIEIDKNFPSLWIILKERSKHFRDKSVYNKLKRIKN